MLKNLLKEYKLNDKQIDLLNQLRGLVTEYNKHTNITSIIEEKEFNEKHILDSISIVKFYDLENKTILDVGSGGGLPGLVLAIVVPSSKITMLDSNNKKIEFINYAIKELELKNSSTIYSRIEVSDTVEKYDIVLSRAVSPLNILLEITSPSVKVNGELIYYKGINLEQELPKKWEIVKEKLGIDFIEINTFNLNDSTIRKFISFKKINSKRKTQIRDFSQIKKKPIF